MRELFASLLSGWVAQSRENGQINGYLGCFAVQTEPGLQALFSFFIPFIIVISVTISSAISVDTVVYHGLEKTKDEAINRIIDIETNHIYSDSLNDTILFRIDQSGLFDSVQISVDTISDSSVLLNISIHEKSLLYLSGIGGTFYTIRYGDDAFPWLDANLQFTMRNPLGNGHKMSLYGNVWRRRHVGVLWEIPILNGFFFEWGTSVGSRPSLYDSWHARLDLRSTVGIGKWFGRYNKFLFTISPRYNRIELTDTEERDHYWEIISTLKYSADLRDVWWDPHTGFYFSQSATTNRFLPYRDPVVDENVNYLCGTTDVRGYVSPGNGRVTIAGQLLAEMTYSGSQNRYYSYYMGGNSTLRGFGEGSFGTDALYNNRATASLEFRFQVASVAGMNLSIFRWYDPSMTRLPFDIDLGVFLNAGYLWKDIETLFDLEERYNAAAAAGLGVRVMFPTLDMSGVIDLGWPVYAPGDLFTSIPTVHIYVNLPF